jgi:predicted transcriptional regulator
MSEVLTVELPDDLARQARALAAATNRRLEDAVLDWVRQAIAERAVESLPNDDLLALCDLTLEDAQQAELSDLLTQAREGALSVPDQERLDHLMVDYRRGLVLKARALKEATARGLRPPLADDAA